LTEVDAREVLDGDTTGVGIFATTPVVAMAVPGRET